jgi:hypothetical protein
MIAAKELTMKKTFLLIIFLLMSAACAGMTDAPLPTLAPTLESPRATPAVIPPIAVTLTTQAAPPTAAPQNTQAPTAVAAAPTPKPESKNLGQGATPEGFFTLGDANAKVTVIDYSDFL